MTVATHSHRRYRIQHPTIRDVMRDMRIPATDPGPGDRVPDFDLPTTDSGRFASEQFADASRPVLLVFGSLTCPVTESAGNGLHELHARYGRQVRFVMVNVREAHPGEATTQPETAKGKQRHASGLESHHGFPFEVAVDDIDGSLHRAFGTRPSSAYVIDPTGTIVFRAHWSNITDALDEALAAVVAGHQPPRATAGHTLRSMAKMTGHADVAFANAGSGAMRDTWRAAPPFAAMIMLSRLFRFLPRDRRGVPTLVTMAAMLALFVVVGLLALT